MYNKTTWVDNVTPLNAENLNNIEEGIAAIDKKIGGLTKVQIDEVINKMSYLTPEALQLLESLSISINSDSTLKEKYLCGDGQYRYLSANIYNTNLMDGDRVVITIPYFYGQAIEQPNELIKEGYDFIGWYKDPLLTIPFDFTNATQPKGDVNIYAKFIEVSA